MTNQSILDLAPRRPATIDIDGLPTLRDDPTPELRFGMGVAAVFFVGFLGWAALAPLDSAAYATGKVAVAGQRQAVQHREGGIVGALHVKEGDRVRKGDVLIELAGADVRAQERALAAQVIGLQAQRSRLLAEQMGGPIRWPAEFASADEADRLEIEQAMQIQQAQFGARASTLDVQGGVLNQRTAQLNEQIAGMGRQIDALDEQTRLLNDELAGVRELNRRGFAPLTQVRALERTLAQLKGQRAQLAASIAASRQGIGETRLQNVELGKTKLEQVAAELREVQFQLNEAVPRWRAVREQLARTQLRAPASGAVVGLSVFTVGGVISPGQTLLEIVPEDAPLVLEARIAPSAADDLSVGQPTEIQFSGLHERDLPRLHGEITRLSADSFTDANTGESYFQAEVKVPPGQLAKIRQVRGSTFKLRPGMPVQVLVPLRKRTAMQYLTEPLTKALWRSFREG